MRVPQFPDEFKVDFFGIGPPKTASTWLHRCLRSHPKVCIAWNKEPDYFPKYINFCGRIANPDYLGPPDHYTRFFKHKYGSQILGDFSVNLFFSEEAPKIISSVFPDSKAIVTLRDPVKRLHSHFWHSKRCEERVNLPPTFEDYILSEENQGEIRRFLDYANPLNRWVQVLGEANVLILFDFSLKEDPMNWLKPVYSFLDIDPSHEPGSRDTRIKPNLNRGWFYRLGESFATSLRDVGFTRLVEAMKTAGAESLFEKFTTTPQSKPSLSPEIQEGLRELAEPSILELEQFVAVDLNRWTSK